MKYKIFNEDCIKTMDRLSEKGLKVDVISRVLRKCIKFCYC